MIFKRPYNVPERKFKSENSIWDMFLLLKDILS